MTPSPRSIDAMVAEKEPSPKVIARLTTTYFKSKRGIHSQKNITFLKRQCEGYNFLEDETAMVGVGDTITRIINLDECKDGIYQVVICNESKDFETGHIDDYDFKLICLAALKVKGITI